MSLAETVPLAPRIPFALIDIGPLSESHSRFVRITGSTTLPQLRQRQPSNARHWSSPNRVATLSP